MLRYSLVLLIAILTGRSALSQCGGLDIFIANDQSGSVDANENQKSREFISIFAQHLPLGNNAGGFRIAIADWDYSRGWQQFGFPQAGKDYTTSFSDVVAYVNAPRVLSGGTDLVLALQKSYEAIQANADKTRPKVIVLLTDAQTSGYTQPGLVELADQIKYSGVYIVVMAIEAARFFPDLIKVASSGGYFSADSYDQLAGDAAIYAETIAAAACNGNQPAFDLGIRLNAFDATGCFPGPGTYTLNYEIQNTGQKAWDDDIVISLYDNNPALNSTTPIVVFNTGKIRLDSGGVYYGTYSNPVLADHQAINAIVNFDGVAAAITMPAFPYQIMPLLVVGGERSSVNNLSNNIARTNTGSCIPTATVNVNVQADSIGCGQTVGYTVNICNNGNLDTRLNTLEAIPDPKFSLLYANSNIDSAKTTYYNTYFGGSNSDYAYGATTDKFGYIYVTGQTNSANNIVTPGAYRTNNGGTQDAFLAKFNTAGQRIWATYLGGPGPENGYSVATDNEGNVYIAGETSNSPNIATGTGWQINSGGNYDAYLAKFDANGSLLWSTYYGGTAADYGRSVITDSHGNVYLAGNTSSATGIASPGTHQSAFGGGTDAFLVKFNKDGVRKWASYYGGTGTESGFGIAVDSHDNVYLTGLTGSTTNIATPGSFQPAKDAGNDAYLVKFDSNGVRRWATYYGGNNSDNSTAIRIDRADMVYITGNTSSTNNLATASSQQTTNNGNTDAFLAKFDTSGQRIWSTYYGGTGTDNGRQVNTDNNGNVYLSGSTASSTGIATPDAIQPTYGGNTDAYLVKFDKNGVRKWATYFGGTDMDIASASVTDAQGKLYMTGATQSLQIATLNAFQYPYGGGGNDAFLLKIDEQYSFILKAGNCVTMHYYYDASSALPGNHDFSYALQTDKIAATDPTAIVRPEADGFHGSLHSSDDISIAHNTPVCQPGDKITLSLHVIPIQSCGSASYTMATITINNSSGISAANTVLNLTLNGSGAFLSSELYGSAPIPAFPRPDISDPLYPAVTYALLNKSGAVSIPLYNIPAGVSSINIGISAGISTILFSAQLTAIPAFFNASGQSNTVTDQSAITLTALPSISGWNFPASISQNQTLQLSGITTANAKTLQWVSATAGNLPNGGTITNPALTYTPTPADIANGYIMLSMTILNDAGCDASQTAYIKIDNVSYDYGDAPPGYDLKQSKTPFSAASTLLDGLYLGSKSPSTEAQAKHSPDATGDGNEEDGLAEICPLKPVAGENYSIKVAATNNTANTAYLYAFIDWNADGDWLDAGEAAHSPVVVPPGSGYKYYTLVFKVPFNVNVDAARYFTRLRLSLDSSAVKKSFGPAAGGETEDHLLAMCNNNECVPFVPTAFTPNGNGSNEGFRLIFRCPVSSFTLMMYNRWGQKVFESNDPKMEWDGRVGGILQASGVYIWYCRYQLNGIPTSKKGIVTLLR